MTQPLVDLNGNILNSRTIVPQIVDQFGQPISSGQPIFETTERNAIDFIQRRISNVTQTVSEKEAVYNNAKNGYKLMEQQYQTVLRRQQAQLKQKEEIVNTIKNLTKNSSPAEVKAAYGKYKYITKGLEKTGNELSTLSTQMTNSQRQLNNASAEFSKWKNNLSKVQSELKAAQGQVHKGVIEKALSQKPAALSPEIIDRNLGFNRPVINQSFKETDEALSHINKIDKVFTQKTVVSPEIINRNLGFDRPIINQSFKETDEALSHINKIDKVFTQKTVVSPEIIDRNLGFGKQFKPVPPAPVPPVPPTPVPPTPTPHLGKAGKIALIVGAVALVGVGIAWLCGAFSKKDKKETVENEDVATNTNKQITTEGNQQVIDESNMFQNLEIEDAYSENTIPANPVTNVEEEEIVDGPAETETTVENQVKYDNEGTIKVAKKDSLWNIVKALYENKDPEFKKLPEIERNIKIQNGVRKMMKANGLEYADNSKWLVLIYPGQTLKQVELD